jgi:hypothetical protein
MNTRTRRAAGLIAVTTAAILALTGCMSVTYKLSVNSDATLSGTLQVQLAREIASTFGITSKDLLSDSITSGELSENLDAQVAKNCKVAEDSTNYTVNCSVDHVQASDIDESWSLTKVGTNLTFHIVSAGQGEDASTSSLMPDMELGQFTFSATFPGAISSVTGEGATKTDANTVEVKGSLSKNIDVTVVASSEGSSSNSNLIIFLVIGIAVVILLVISLLILRRPKKRQAPAEDPTV